MRHFGATYQAALWKSLLTSTPTRAWRRGLVSRSSPALAIIILFFQSLPILKVTVDISPYFNLHFFTVRSWPRPPQVSPPKKAGGLGQGIPVSPGPSRVTCSPLSARGPSWKLDCHPHLKCPFLLSLEPRPPAGPHPKVTFLPHSVLCRASRRDWPGAQSVPRTLWP